MKKILIALSVIVCAFSLNAQNTDSENVKNHAACNKVCCGNVHNFTMSLGYGFALSGDHDALLLNYNSDDSHNSKMRHGINYRFDYDYKFHRNFKAGAVFNMYNSFDSYYAADKSVGTSSDDRWLFYAGLSFSANTDVIKEHYTLFAKATMGYMNFRNAQRAYIETASQVAGTTYKKAALGYGIAAGASYSFNQYFSLDCFLDYMGASVSKLKTNDATFDLDKNENLSRINLNVGVRLKL
ncbi:MAG: hypothetical protein IJ250_01455 [Bacteroidales bacterium]|nr:hypothetical protein [Bacteroidales bacterium]